MTRYKHFTLMLLGLAGLTLTSACSSMSYVPNTAFRGYAEASAYDEDAVKAPQKFGALRLVTPARGDSLDAEPSERLFLLKRSGKAYMAETLLTDNDENPKAMFDKSFLAFGTNREDRSIGLTLRFVY